MLCSGSHSPNLDLHHQYQMQHMLQQQYDNSCQSPIVINNNPKLKSLLEPFVIAAYGQLKQPNANSSFQSNDLNDLDYEASDDADQVFCPTNSGGGVILVSCSTN